MGRAQELPDECWALVFSRLNSKADRDATALTCRRWRSLEALSRRSLRFVEHWGRQDHYQPLHLFLLQALHSFPNILSISIHVSGRDLHYAFSRVFQHKGFSQLTSLDLSIRQDFMDDHLLQCLAAGCPSLIHLSLCTSDISDAGMQSLADGCPFLQILDMSYCSITDKGIDVLLSKCIDMRQFAVDECPIEGWGFRHGKRLEKLKATEGFITDAGLAEALQGASSLRALSLTHIIGMPELSVIGDYCEGLEALNLMWACSLDDISMAKIVGSCKNLRVLDVPYCHYVTLRGWKALARSGKKLEKLDVTGCEKFNPRCLRAIQVGCPNLQLLKVSEYFELHPSMAQLKICRPTVKVQFYGEYYAETDDELKLDRTHASRIR